MKKFIFTAFIFLNLSNVFAQDQQWTLDKIQNKWTKGVKRLHEGFYELNANNRNYTIALIYSVDHFEVVYISGNLEYWSPGMSKGKVFESDNKYVTTWNFGNINHPSIAKHEVKFIDNKFIISLEDGQTNIFTKIGDDDIKTKKSSATIIQMVPDLNGIYQIPALVNTTTKTMVNMETGLAETEVSPEFALSLLKGKQITDADWLKGSPFNFGDGSAPKSNRFLIHSIKIGTLELKNIEATVTPNLPAQLVIGQNALLKSGLIQFDFNNKQLKIVSNGTDNQ
jgi:hypothetical protein